MSSQASYELVPYGSASHAASHPDRLATMATLFGLKPARADCCRVLELGCAEGGNLIPMAVELPQSQFLGIDHSARQVAAGHEIIAGLGLKNIELRAESILDVNDGYGPFDFIIAHGVYSWVDGKVQDKILEICLHNLAPDGVGYISYNTLPGWHMQGIIRDIMLYYIGRAGGDLPENQIAGARSLLDFLARSVAKEKTPYSLLLNHTVQRLQSSSDAYIFHDYLEECNEPIYFSEFCSRLTAKNLRYLGEAHISDMGTFRFSVEVRQVLSSLASNQIQLEQYLDFLLNRTFRQTLVCHQHHDLSYRLRTEQVGDFYVASNLTPKEARLDMAGNTAEVFLARNGITLETSEPIFKAALCCLGESWPRAIAFDDLLQRAQVRAGSAPAADGRASDQDNLALRKGLLQVLTQTSGMVELWQCPPQLAAAANERPLASPLARWQAPRQKNVTNLRHETLPISDLDRHLLPILDGSRDRQALVASLGNLDGSRDRQALVASLGNSVRQGALNLANELPRVPGDLITGDMLASLVEERLAWLARAALLLA